ncbi:MAG: flagellin, partial [Proteobacteria bacterium]|nr:flagellin [Pseudomonadota bacterium]
MGLRIRTNVASLNSQRRLGSSTEALQNSMNKLSSGSRINKAADDAAGLAVSENLRADVRGLNQAKRNANDGISLVQTAEGGLEETSNMLVRLRELAVQAASDTIGNTERGFLNQEYMQLKDEIDRIATSTEFNGTRLLVGDRAGDLPEELQTEANSFPLEIQVGKDYYNESDAIDNRNQVNIIKIDMSKLNAFTSGLGIGEAEPDEGGGGTRVDSKVNAQQSIGSLDGAITKVNEYRAYLGAIQNRFQSSINNLGVQVENLDTARSRIRDADYASETATFTQASILQQAGTSVLSQANQQPQIALSL